jgi:hypothetical protein
MLASGERIINWPGTSFRDEPTAASLAYSMIACAVNAMDGREL